jgi:hypothetical protein
MSDEVEADIGADFEIQADAQVEVEIEVEVDLPEQNLEDNISIDSEEAEMEIAVDMPEIEVEVELPEEEVNVSGGGLAIQADISIEAGLEVEVGSNAVVDIKVDEISVEIESDRLVNDNISNLSEPMLAIEVDVAVEDPESEKNVGLRCSSCLVTVAIIFWFALLVFTGICGWQLSEILGTKEASGFWWWVVYLLTPIILFMIGVSLCAFYRDKKIKEIKAEYQSYKRGLYA